jgi:hypothetical protein
VPRLNYTGRKRILRKWVRLGRGIQGNNTTLTLSDLMLESLELPADGRVIVEAMSARMSQERFTVGSVESLTLPQTWPMPSVDNAPITVRIKVVDSAASHARILAVADGIRVRADESDPDHRSRASLLPVERATDLGQRLWRLRFTETGPVLLVNHRLSDWQGFASDRRFQTTTFPEIVSQIVTRLMPEITSDFSPETYQYKWLQFFKSMGHDLASEAKTIADFDEDVSEYNTYVYEQANEIADALAVRKKALDVYLEAQAMTDGVR